MSDLGDVASDVAATQLDRCSTGTAPARMGCETVESTVYDNPMAKWVPILAYIFPAIFVGPD